MICPTYIKVPVTPVIPVGPQPDHFGSCIWLKLAGVYYAVCMVEDGGNWVLDVAQSPSTPTGDKFNSFFLKKHEITLVNDGGVIVLNVAQHESLSGHSRLGMTASTKTVFGAPLSNCCIGRATHLVATLIQVIFTDLFRCIYLNNRSVCLANDSGVFVMEIQQ